MISHPGKYYLPRVPTQAPVSFSAPCACNALVETSEAQTYAGTRAIGDKIWLPKCEIAQLSTDSTLKKPSASWKGLIFKT